MKYHYRNTVYRETYIWHTDTYLHRIETNAERYSWIDRRIKYFLIGKTEARREEKMHK